ncbi:lipoate--protein ligase [Chakrabartyella piscis]|uniref:lipoate--protein ligase n=1 Tax=Chakrabartyella piscis TaxID=2918914 RepID=UPI00295863C6|nr:lipoate--protein ligase [Chakrabartyella piscis]
MIFINVKNTDPTYNLALEQFVFDELDQEQDYFMLWQNDNAIIVGKNQNAFAEINHTKVEAAGTKVVRRLSGGGAVYHDMGNINFTFIVDAKGQSELDMKLFCKPVVDLIQSLGAPAEVSGRNDILIDGKKISGNAQYINKGRVMHHGTIMFDSNLDLVAAILNVQGDKYISKATKSVRSRVTNVKDYIQTPISVEEFKTKLAKYIVGDTQPLELTEAQEKRLREIQKERYSQWDWNYGKQSTYELVKERRFEGCGRIEAHMNTQDGVIEKLKFYGDFFGMDDVEGLCERLVGVELKRECLQKALDEKILTRYFHGITLDEFIDLLL